MTVLVNYYTCSYGDSFVNMFNGNPTLRVNGIAHCNFSKFVEPIFYTQTLDSQQRDWQQCQDLELNSAPCHRQLGYDFAKVLDKDIKVITIELDNIDFLPKRLKKIHLDGRNKAINDPVLDKILKAHPDRYQEVIAKDYQNWLKHNRLQADIEFRFEWIHDPDTVQKFCDQHNLGFDNAWLENIKHDLKQYALL